MGDNHENAVGGNEEEEAPFPLTDVDRWVLSQTDEEFKYHDWEELKEIIGEAALFTCCYNTVVCLSVLAFKWLQEIECSAI
jgi:hypothetical protein